MSIHEYSGITQVRRTGYFIEIGSPSENLDCGRPTILPEYSCMLVRQHVEYYSS